jgi:hypothetical protein
VAGAARPFTEHSGVQPIDARIGAVDVQKGLAGARAFVDEPRDGLGLEPLLGDDEQRPRARKIERCAGSPYERGFAGQGDGHGGRVRRHRRDTTSVRSNRSTGMHGVV